MVKMGTYVCHMLYVLSEGDHALDPGDEYRESVVSTRNPDSLFLQHPIVMTTFAARPFRQNPLSATPYY